ncbi:MAG: NAD(P)-binding domain-containing protein [Planctomycetales bacterium]|nr:NAD(P)-binding domain-containing protein [Planctomycetales bacterium]
MRATHHEYIILGGGPSGIQLGYYLQRDGRDYLILEAGDRPGTFFRTYPRHGKLISINKVHTGTDDPELRLRHDWNSLLTDDYSLLFRDYSQEFFPSSDSLLRYLSDYVNQFNIQICFNTRVTRVERTADGFRLTDDAGQQVTCDRLVVATGVSQPYIPEIPGIELCEQYDSVSVDPNDFVNQRVLIVGKGNSAFETADNLIATAAIIHLVSPYPIDFAWKTHYVGDLRAVNNNILDTYQLKSQNAILDAETMQICRQADGRLAVTFRYKHAEGEVEQLVYDRVICCTGFRFDCSIFDDSSRPELTIFDRFPNLTCEWESTNQPGMYFIGTLMQMRDYKKTTSGFIHGFRYNVQAFSNLLSQKYHDVDWPYVTLPLEATRLCEHFLSRVNGSSALWQQQSFLGDVCVVQPDGSVRYYEGMPIAYLQKHFVDEDKRCFVLTLEFGTMAHDEDPFKVNRIRRDNVAKAAASTFLHPAIREYEFGAKVSEHHIIEDLDAVWQEEEHVVPLNHYLEQRIRSTENRVAWE